MNFLLRLALAALLAATVPAAAWAAEGTDTKQKYKALEPVAERGVAVAQHELGVMYRTGKGAPRNYAAAAKWFGKAAEQGMPEAQNNLGGLYAVGQGVGKNLVQAYKWFELAAKQGLPEARNNRDQVAKVMTPQEVTKGKALARGWKPKKTPVSE